MNDAEKELYKIFDSFKTPDDKPEPMRLIYIHIATPGGERAVKYYTAGKYIDLNKCNALIKKYELEFKIIGITI